jgi:hypothetical protein
VRNAWGGELDFDAAWKRTFPKWRPQFEFFHQLPLRTDGLKKAGRHNV